MKYPALWIFSIAVLCYTTRALDLRLPTRCFPIFPPEMMICPKLYHPICGPNSKTYSNECQMCKDILVQLYKEFLIYYKHEGRCALEDYPSNVVFKSKYHYIVSSRNDISTKENSEYARRTTEVHYPREAVCWEQSQLCLSSGSPVCGTDGITYPSECFVCKANRAAIKSPAFEEIRVAKPSPC